MSPNTTTGNATLHFDPALDNPHLLAPTVLTAVLAVKDAALQSDLLVAEIDPQFANGEKLCEQYAIPTNEGANCIIISARRGQNNQLAACVAPVGTKVDLNGIIKKILNARRISLAPLELVLKETQMEYGSITPIGLPESWPILIDEAVATANRVVLGSGKLNAKISLSGKTLIQLTHDSEVHKLSK